MISVEALAKLYRDTAEAHRATFAATHGKDPEWPLWYAQQLKPSFDRLLGSRLTVSEIVALLVNLHREHRARAPERPWDEVFAELTAERHVDGTDEKLALYRLDFCVFCMRVERVLGELGVPVEIRDIWDEPRFREELVAARGRPTVPVLRCESPDGEVRWLPESADIIRYLRRRSG